jgi:hypothetical protein
MVTTIVDDPRYLTPLHHGNHFRREAEGGRWIQACGAAS